MKRLFFLLCISLASLQSIAQSDVFTFNHVALSVEDAEVSTEFYKEIFGLKEITNRTEVEGIRWVSLGEDKELHLISVIEGPVAINKAVHFALTTIDFDSFINRLKEMNVNFSSWSGEQQKITFRADGIRQVYVQDPDGYWIEVNSSSK